MPVTIGSLPYDCLAFYGGCVAKRNNLLQEGEGGLPYLMSQNRTKVYTMYILCVVYTMCAPQVYFNTVDGATTDGYQSTAVGLFGIIVVSGMVTVLSFPVMLDLFKTRFNFTGKWCKILAGSAYVRAREAKREKRSERSEASEAKRAKQSEARDAKRAKRCERNELSEAKRAKREYEVRGLGGGLL
jgi:hypothetical protein